MTGLSRIGMLLRSEGWRRGEATGLTPTQAQILIHLVVRGPARIGAVAAEIAVTQPTASDAVAALVRKGHVEKRPDPADSRAVQLHPTESGRCIADEIAAWPDALLGAVEVLDDGERAVFLKGLTKMIGTLQVRGAIPVQRMCVSCAHFRPNVHSDAASPHHCAFVDAAFGDASLRLDCGDHVEADATARLESWTRFTQEPVPR
jgi:DNA-binding MarR family transcriptional regulator